MRRVSQDGAPVRDATRRITPENGVQGTTKGGADAAASAPPSFVGLGASGHSTVTRSTDTVPLPANVRE